MSSSYHNQDHMLEGLHWHSPGKMDVLHDWLQFTRLSIINTEYEYIALHRDVGETELKQVGIGLVRQLDAINPSTRAEKLEKAET